MLKRFAPYREAAEIEIRTLNSGPSFSIFFPLWPKGRVAEIRFPWTLAGLCHGGRVTFLSYSAVGSLSFPGLWSVCDFIWRWSCFLCLPSLNNRVCMCHQGCVLSAAIHHPLWIHLFISCLGLILRPLCAYRKTEKRYRNIENQRLILEVCTEVSYKKQQFLSTLDFWFFFIVAYWRHDILL